MFVEMKSAIQVGNISPATLKLDSIVVIIAPRLVCLNRHTSTAIQQMPVTSDFPHLLLLRVETSFSEVLFCRAFGTKTCFVFVFGEMF